jgi:hypothetical protein
MKLSCNVITIKVALYEYDETSDDKPIPLGAHDSEEILEIIKSQDDICGCIMTSVEMNKEDIEV